MLPYIILLLISIVCLFFPDKKWAKVLSLLSLFVMSAFRGENVGTDTIEYLNETGLYRMTSFDQIGKGIEYIYNSLLLLISKFGLSGRVIIIVFSSVTFGTIPFIAKRLGISPVYICYLFLVGQFVLSLNIARQIAAGMLIALGTTFIFESEIKKSLAFFMFIALAIGFHATSVVFALLYLCRYVKIGYRPLVIISVVFLILSLLGIFDVSVIENYTQYFGDYANSYSDIFYSDTDSISFFGWIVPIMIAFVKVFLLRNNVNSSWLFLFLIAIAVPFFFKGASSVLGRMLIPFGIISNFILAESMGKSAKGSTDRLISFIMVIPLSYIYIRSVAGNNQILPYYFGF